MSKVVNFLSRVVFKELNSCIEYCIHTGILDSKERSSYSHVRKSYIHERSKSLVTPRGKVAKLMDLKIKLGPKEGRRILWMPGEHRTQNDQLTAFDSSG